MTYMASKDKSLKSFNVLKFYYGNACYSVYVVLYVYYLIKEFTEVNKSLSI